MRYIRGLFFLLLAVSCVQQGTQTRALSKNASTTSGSNTNGTTSTGTTALAWTGGPTVTKALLINSDSSLDFYIKGSSINSFLGTSTNRQNIYCLKTTFANATNALYLRGIPYSVLDTTTNSTVRMLRFNFNDSSSNGLCTPSAANSVAALPTVCPTCLTLIKSSALELYKCPSGTTSSLFSSTCPALANKITLSDLPTLSLNINPNNNSSSTTAQCTNDQCTSAGYNCCLEQQCVMDGQARQSAVIQNSSEYQQAKAVVTLNPLSFINYPQFYYVCPNVVHQSTTTNSVVVNDTSLTSKIQDYYCVQELKNQTTASTPTPFHQFFANPSSTLTGTIGSTCNGGSTCKCIYDGDLGNTIQEQARTNYYKAVMNRLYDRCGCKKDNFTLEQKVPVCPSYDYVLTYDLNGNINDVVCYTPNPTNYNTNTILNITNVPIKSKAVPHIFFTSSGSAVYDYLTILSATVVQDADTFRYIDTAQYYPMTGASIPKYNMTAILGNLTANNNGAYPAKTFNVKPGTNYYITVESGYYSPCKTCGQDSWFNGYTAFPQTGEGVGIRPTGYTTVQNGWGKGTNTSLSNWEDLIFGRACWLPPTMLPFSHNPDPIVKNQRNNRLKTQATYYVNGYQRDWYGFNKGAVIGSFDGVRWFAIGKSRIAMATTSKFHVAINGIMGDITEDADQVISIREFDGTEQNSAATVDWDPDDYLSSKRNDGATCQRYHICETDSDCISALGWEYMCADVRNVKTFWPRFTATTGLEVANTPATSTSAIDYLYGANVLNTYKPEIKRCIYRGAGTPCYSDIANIVNPDIAKNLTCAPNFYCARYDKAAFNSQIARVPHSLEDVPNNKDFFGRDADVLGRPLNYIGSDLLVDSATTALVQNIKNWIGSYTASVDNFSTAYIGLCRPGKLAGSSTASNMAEQHNSISTSTTYTDKINQIGPCNVSLGTTDQFSSCPFIGPDGNLSYSSTRLVSISPADLRFTAGATLAVTNFTLVDESTVNFKATVGTTDYISFNQYKDISPEKITFTGLSSSVAGSKATISVGTATTNGYCDFTSPIVEPSQISFSSTSSSITFSNASKKKGYLCLMLQFSNTATYTMGKINITARGAGAYGGDMAYTQNACGGGEGKSTAGNYLFTTLEMPSATVSTVTQSLMRNACYRRAGALCHTNLDCSPNILHSELAQTIGPNSFGNIPEYNYWAEELICSQDKPEPDPYNSPNSVYSTYQMGLNRCCREVGKDITIFTEDFPGNLDLGIGYNSFNSAKYGWQYPADTKRYSRLSNVDPYKVLSYDEVTPPRLTATTSGTPSITTTYQWQSVGISAEKTCCGGGWIRKFADGTHAWETSADRLHIDVENFKCLNYIYPMITTDPQNPLDRLPTTLTSTFARTATWPDPYTSGAIVIDRSITSTSILISGAAIPSVYLRFNQVWTATAITAQLPASSATARLFELSIDGGQTFSAVDSISSVTIAADNTNITQIDIDFITNTSTAVGVDLNVPIDQLTQEISTYCRGWAGSSDIYGCAQYALSYSPSFDPNTEDVNPPNNTLLDSLYAMTTTVIDTYYGNFKTNPLAFFRPVNAEGSTKKTVIDGASGDSAEYPRALPLILPSYIPRNDTPSSWAEKNLEVWTCDIQGKDKLVSLDTVTPGITKLNDSSCFKCNVVVASTATPCYTAGSSSNSLYKLWRTKDNASTDGTDGLIIDTNGATTVIDKSSTDLSCYFCYDPSNKVLATTHTATKANLSVKIKYPVSSFFPKNATEETHAVFNRNKTRATNPGNINYYMNKLGKFELVGIPQIYYEPIYCNNDCSQLVPGFFDSPLGTTASLITGGHTFTAPLTSDNTPIQNPSASAPICMASGQEKIATNYKALKIPPVFAANDFICCKTLGQETTDPSLCCSGYGVAGSSGVSTCKLPPKTNLNVYFNRFVSSESGTASGITVALVDSDFNTSSGEPLNSDAVYGKLIKIAQAHCSSASYKTGEAIGVYSGEPNANYNYTSQAKLWSFIDSSNDINNYNTNNIKNSSGSGYQAFYNGYRWNHHVYCKE